MIGASSNTEQRAVDSVQARETKPSGEDLDLLELLLTSGDETRPKKLEQLSWILSFSRPEL
jgi:hypothetical protein